MGWQVLDRPRRRRSGRQVTGEGAELARQVADEGAYLARQARQFLQPVRQAGIGGVPYEDIYLAIGVAATALFIIETLYKTYQLYTSAGRSLGEGAVALAWPPLLEAWPPP